MVLLSDIVARVSTLPDLYARIEQAQLLAFFDIGTRFAPFIDLINGGPGSQSLLLPALPENIQTVLSNYTDLPLEEVVALWGVLGDIVLRARPGELVLLPGQTDAFLTQAGPAHNLGAEIMIGPVSSCETEGCPRRGRSIAGKRQEYSAHLFTRRRGILPIRVVTQYCKGCHTTYRPNYVVHRAESPQASRVYYKGVPEVIEVTEHAYIDKELVVLFRAQMAFAHASGDVVARIYNLGLSSEHPTRAITGEMVWNGFYLHALLADSERRGQTLQLPHHGKQSARFNEALRERNRLMRGPGQPLWAHACDDCEHIIPPPEGTDAPWTRLSACVMDGVTVGHPRCNVRYCTVTLSSPRHRFCPQHAKQETECAIEGCTEPITRGFRTCLDPAHREHERQKREHGMAIFRLKRRIGVHAAAAQARLADDILDDVEVEMKLQAAAGEDDARAQDDDSGSLTEAPIPCSDVLDRADVADMLGSNPRIHHSEGTKQARRRKGTEEKIRAALTRRWTHNEQLMVRCCGVIISRATFFESEGVAEALRFIQSTFPDDFPRGRPSFLFYDNQCNLLRHMRASGKGAELARVGMAVDVFHANTKHSDTDEFCQTTCNPALFPELYNERHEWRFNSSAAEQVNGWFGKFLPVVREMSEVHYNFFLDEMISIYNDFRVEVQRKRGRRPRMVPLEELRMSL